MFTHRVPSLRLVFCLVLVMLGFAVCEVEAQKYAFPSQADEWTQKPLAQKRAFLDGFCKGAIAGGSDERIGDSTCWKSGDAVRKGRRLCGSLSLDDGARAVRYVDRFYSDKNHSEIRFWAVVTSYNDSECGDNNVLGKLELLQVRGVCLQKSITLSQAQVSGQIQAQQLAECERQ